MTTAIIDGSKADVELLIGLAKKLGMKARLMSKTEAEDAGLLQMMKETDRSRKVSRAKVMKTLSK